MNRILKLLASVTLAWIGLFHAQSATAAETTTLVDLAGRSVTLELPVKRMILGEGRFLPTLAILDREDPTRWVAGMMFEFKRLDPSTYAQYQAHFPHIDDIAQIGQTGATSFNLESAIAARPDVAIFSLGAAHGPSERDGDLLKTLELAGIPVVFIDLRIDPLVNTPKSVALLGRLMGRDAEAKAFLDFYRPRLDRVRDRLRDIEVRPSVFMEIRVGLRDTCCEAMGRDLMGRFIEWAGGRNLVADKISGTHGMVNVEYLLTHQPDVYIGTAIGNAVSGGNAKGRIVLGAMAKPDQARDSFRTSARRLGIAQLEAVKDGRAYAIWHHFYNTPMNVAAVEAMAKWLHPHRFADLSPRATLEEYFARFQPFPVDGVYWTDLTGRSEE